MPVMREEGREGTGERTVSIRWQQLLESRIHASKDCHEDESERMSIST